jgi:hypothetical protein
MSLTGSRALRTAITVAWAASITFTMQFWVGRSTIYRPELNDRIADAHEAILHNRVPDGSSWTTYGLNSTNIRVGSVFIAEGISRVSGWSAPTAYRMLDTLALFATLVLLLQHLGRLVPAPYPVIGALAFATTLPLTYQLFYFHPWDRLSLLSWVVLLILLERRRFGLFTIALPLAMLVKFDVILLPALYFLLTVPFPPRDADRQGVMRSALATTGLFALTFGTYWALQAWRPGGFEPVALGPLAIHNVTMLRDLKLAYPPLLGLGVPLLLAAVGFSRSERFARSCAVFAVLLLLVFVVKARFEEFRALLPVFVLLLPAALVGLQSVTEPGALRGAEAVVKASGS